MQSYEERRRRQRELQAIRKDVERELKRIPGVTGVGIGFKRSAGQLVRDIVFTVFVDHKKPLDEVPSDQLIPRQIGAIPTDVLTPFRIRRAANSATPTPAYLQLRHRPLVGGMRITNNKKTLDEKVTAWEIGTLGCIARLNRDGSTMLLSNQHVMFAKGAGVGDTIAQALYQNFYCCKCNVVGIIEAGIFDDHIDAAIARLDPDVAALNEVVGIGEIAGSDAAVVGDIVQKVGQETGLTTGEVTDIAANLLDVGGPPMFDQILIHSSTGSFADEGDSGSVIIRESDKKVVGLFHGCEPGDRSFGFACHIAEVESRLGISIISGSFATASSASAAVFAAAVAPVHAQAAGDPLNPLERKLEQSAAGQWMLRLINRHEEEMAFLINQRRAVTLAWQRKQGPAFLAALLRKAKEPDYQMPAEIEGVSRQNFLMSMATVLEDHGSASLRQTIKQHGLAVITAVAQSSEIDEILRGIETNVNPDEL
jgi:hypothetical protein